MGTLERPKAMMKEGFEAGLSFLTSAGQHIQGGPRCPPPAGATHRGSWAAPPRAPSTGRLFPVH
jgi:hypothetical protein